MWKLLVFLGVLCWDFMVVNCSGHTGPGKYNVIYIQKCGDNNHEMQIDVNKKKINRTHDGFDANIKLKRSLNNELGIQTQLYRKVDGGYKLQQEFLEPSLPNFLYRYSESNTRKCLKSAGIEPPDFPVPPGEYIIKNFSLDYREMPLDGMYGEYTGKIHILDGLRAISCFEADIEFKKDEENDDDEDEE